MNNTFLLKQALSLGAAAIVSAAPLAVQGAALIPAHLPVAGVSQNQLAVQYSQWLLRDFFGDPLDQALLSTANPSPVTFLPVTFDPAATYHLTISAGAPLFFPVVVGVVWFDDDQTADGPPCDTAADRFACHQVQLAAFMDNPTSLTLRVDGVEIPIPYSQRLNSGGLTFDLDGTLVGFKGLHDGWWAALTPLSAGQHLVEYGFDYAGQGVMQTAYLNAVPVSSSLSLVVAAMLLLAVQRKPRGGGGAAV